MAIDEKTQPEEKTYRELVQDIWAGLDRLYDQVGYLRDAADLNEKQIYNDTRGLLSDIARAWDRFDNNMPDNRATMVLNNWLKRLR